MKLVERIEQRLPLLEGKQRDVPARQQTLRATIDWSYELLVDDEKLLFARLSAFVGGCTLEAAEEVCAAELDTLASLVDKSLVRQSGGRVWMLQTIREYAVARLEESGEAGAVRQAHANFYLAVAEEAEQLGSHGDRRTYVAPLADEHDNLRAALSFLRVYGEPMLFLRLAKALCFFWSIEGQWDEGISWLEDALERTPATTAFRANALLGLSGLESRRDLERSRSAAEESIAIFRSLDDEEGLWEALSYAGHALTLSGATTEARQVLEEAQGLATRSGNPKWIAEGLCQLCNLALWEGDYERASDLAAQALPIVREVGDQQVVAPSVFNLGLAAFQLGRYAEALSSFQESLRICLEIGWKAGIALSGEAIGAVFAQLGDTENAARLIGYGEARRAELGYSLERVEQAMRSITVDRLRKQLGSHFDALLAEGRELTLEEAVACALDGVPLPAK